MAKVVQALKEREELGLCSPKKLLLRAIIGTQAQLTDEVTKMNLDAKLTAVSDNRNFEGVFSRLDEVAHRPNPGMPCCSSWHACADSEPCAWQAEQRRTAIDEAAVERSNVAAAQRTEALKVCRYPVGGGGIGHLTPLPIRAAQVLNAAVARIDDAKQARDNDRVVERQRYEKAEQERAEILMLGRVC